MLLLPTWQNLQGKNQLCDLLLRAGGVSVAVHSMVLAAHCPQFIPQLLQLISADHKDSSLPIMQLGNDGKINIFNIYFRQ